MSRSMLIVERVAQILAALLMMAFLTSGILFLYESRWTQTRLDYWRIYDVCLNRSWLQAALWKINNHSLFFPSLIWLADIRFFHNDQQFLFFTGLALLFGTVAMLLIACWRDQTLSLTAKLMATLVVVVGNFWMGRSSITASGGFNCMCSLAVCGALLAFLLLPAVRADSRLSAGAFFLVIAAGFVASFSFGTGLAVWPTLLVLGWSLRFSWKKICLLIVAGLTAAVIYALLPGDPVPHILAGGASSFLPFLADTIGHLCRTIGTPFLYAAAPWHPQLISPTSVGSSSLSLVCGAIGLALAIAAAASKVIRRDLGKSPLELIALALAIFDLAAVAIIALGRVEDLRLHPFEVAAPRYLFWTSLFWTGLFLLGIRRADSKRWERLTVFALALALPILSFPEHYRQAINSWYGSCQAEAGTTSLINRVRDPEKILSLSGIPSQVYRLAPQLQARRLDMFAAGLQDWLGQPKSEVFDRQRRSTCLAGTFAVEKLVKSENGEPAVRIVGWAVACGPSIPKQLVIIDSRGIIRGIARPGAINRQINRQYKLGQFAASGFVGYIRDYQSSDQYTIYSVTKGVLSREKIVLSPVKQVAPRTEG